jgi:hypothetical protein
MTPENTPLIEATPAMKAVLDKAGAKAVAKADAEYDRKMLREIHDAMCGSEYDPKNPGLIRIVDRHAATLYGESGKGGLKADNQKIKRLIWIGIGIITAVNTLFAILTVWALAFRKT